MTVTPGINISYIPYLLGCEKDADFIGEYIEKMGS